MEQLKFIGKRLLYLLVMLLGVATLVFILTKCIPGDPTVANLSQRALNDPEIVAAYKAKYGLDKPYIVQYFLYMWNLLHFDLGTSIRTNNPVLDELLRCYPATIELALLAIIIAAVLGILFGVISAIRRNSVLDQGVRAVSVTGVSIPSFWFALLMLYFFYYKLHIFPGPGRLSNTFSPPATVTGLYVIDSLLEGSPAKALDALSHLFLPALVLAMFGLYPDSAGQGPWQIEAHHPPRSGERPDSGADGHRSGPGKSSGRHGAGGDDLQLARSGTVRL